MIKVSVLTYDVADRKHQRPQLLQIVEFEHFGEISYAELIKRIVNDVKHDFRWDVAQSIYYLVPEVNDWQHLFYLMTVGELIQCHEASQANLQFKVADDLHVD